jgi:YfiH family protein
VKKYLTIPRFDRIPWLVHGFGTKDWKLRDFQDCADWRNFKIVWLDQVHSDEIQFIDERFPVTNRGEPLERDPRGSRPLGRRAGVHAAPEKGRQGGRVFPAPVGRGLPLQIDKIPRQRAKGDVLATALPGVFLIIKTADCLPLFLVDESRRVVAAVHCGWRGTQKRVAERTVRELHAHYGCEPSSLLAALGPCIGRGCYDVGEDVRQGFKSARLPLDVFRPHPLRPGKYFLNLLSATRLQLRGQGLEEKNIFTLSVCTHCDARLLSYRRDRDKRARLFNFIGVKATHYASFGRGRQPLLRNE